MPDIPSSAVRVLPSSEGEAPTPETCRALGLASTRLQAALWHPRGWYFALW